jgi:hypothetical protein
VATNATFAALQVVLAALLYATHSIHFVVLSALCAGLWAAINWFARELTAHQQQEEEKKKRSAAALAASSQQPARAAASSSGESETEVEAAATTKSSTASLRPRAAGPPPAAVSTVVEPVETVQGELKHRAAAAEELQSPSQGHKSGVSTEDEWEKVSDLENEKDK